MRLFFGLPLSPNAREAVSSRLQEIRKKHRFGKVTWVQPGLYHVTLWFLGEWPESALDKIFGWEEGLRAFSPLSVKLGPLTAFPRVLFLGVQPGEDLVRIYQLISLALHCLHLPDTGRPYVPHLTIGRSKEKGAFRALPEFGDPVPDILDSVVLYESRLLTTGPVYRRITTATL